MKNFGKKSVLMLASFGLLASAPVIAEEAAPVMEEGYTFAPRVSLGAGYYTESGDGAWGGQVAIEDLKSEGLFWGASFEYIKPTGHNEYKVFLTELEANVGYTFAIEAAQGLSVTPFTGIGRETIDIQKGYAKLHNVYLPLGVYLNWQANEELSVGLRGQANFMISNSLEVEGFTFHPKKETTWQAELPVRYSFADQWDVAFVPSIEHKSDSRDEFGVRDSYNLFGARIEVGYSF